MKVTAWKTIDVECECEVGMDDILAEFAARQGEAEETYWRRLVPALDSMTRILAAVPDEVIAAMTDKVREVMRERLTKEADRYKPP